MVNALSNLERLGISWLLVKFRDIAFEKEFSAYRLSTLQQEVRAGSIVAALSWLLVAFMEPMNTPQSAWLSILIASIAGIGSLASVYWATYLKIFKTHHQLIVMAGVIATMLAICIKIKFYPDFPITHYFPVLMIITMWMFSISGLSFIYGIVCGQVFYLFVYLTLLIDEKTSNVDFITCIYYMLVSYFMGAVISYHKDVQSRKIFLAHKELEQEKLHHQHKSIHDPLTKLPNRELLENRLGQAISLASRTGVSCAGLFIDLDNFKSINDEYGHLMGDLYLKQVAIRLKEITRGSDTVARISGDEFFILMLDIKNEEAALSLAKKIQENMQGQFLLSDQFKLKGRGASVGICMFPYTNCKPQDIISRADQAMYQVKLLGKNLGANPGTSPGKNNTATA